MPPASPLEVQREGIRINIGLGRVGLGCQSAGSSSRRFLGSRRRTRLSHRCHNLWFPILASIPTIAFWRHGAACSPLTIKRESIEVSFTLWPLRLIEGAKLLGTAHNGFH